MNRRASDASVHRCEGCGGWVWRSRPCVTCAQLTEQAAAS